LKQRIEADVVDFKLFDEDLFIVEGDLAATV